MRTTCDACAIQIISKAAGASPEQLRTQIFNNTSVQWQQMKEDRKQQFKQQCDGIRSNAWRHPPVENWEYGSSKADNMEQNIGFNQFQNYPIASAFSPFSPAQTTGVCRQPLSQIIDEINPVQQEFMTPVPIRFLPTFHDRN
jgi:hypothetical protein